jgi:hypothetical protein
MEDMERKRVEAEYASQNAVRYVTRPRPEYRKQGVCINEPPGAHPRHGPGYSVEGLNYI